MKGGARSHVLIITISLSLLLLLGPLNASSSAQLAPAGAQGKRIIFRDDDITPWGGLDALKAVNQVHSDEGVPVTLGVIPALCFPAQDNSTGSSQVNEGVPVTLGVIPALCFPAQQSNNVTKNSLFNNSFSEYMRSLASSGLFELAQHGYDHEDNSKQYGVSVPSEFRGMPYTEQYALIEEGRNLMQSAFGTAPTSFIPPYNTGDNNTLRAMSALGFTAYSSFPQDVRPTIDENIRFEPQYVDLYFTRWNASSLELAKNQTERLLSNPRIHDIVVVYHYRDVLTSPNADAVNATKVEGLKDYIQYLKTQNVTFTTLNGKYVTSQFMGVSSNATSPPAPAIPLQAGRPQWFWAVVALATPIVVAAFLWELAKHK